MTMPEPRERRDAPGVINLADEAATAELAKTVASVSRPGDVIALWGDLGTGKTVFARAFINARAGTPQEVPSPTYTLVQIYDAAGGGGIYHFDLYRIEDAGELEELGMEEAFSGGISLIEWPDRMKNLLPADRLDLSLTQGAGQRQAALKG
ncbi:MAG: tRNA threonylcarbamoyladenosine biosynthesis protein TsaE, partial [Alphaproteobacteria bacterium MarineAlpha3_Bin1]